MIILEGPDGAGKTTLKTQLLHAFPDLMEARRACTSEGGPIPRLKQYVDDVFNGLSAALMSGYKAGAVPLYDRFPLISEPIYGPLTRGKMPADWSGPWMRKRYRHLRQTSLVILCLPPLKVVRENLSIVPGQMDGVAKHINAIWWAYNHFSASYTGRLAFYDYTNCDPLDLTLHIQHHIEKRIHA